jgi:hypothetical protein
MIDSDLKERWVAALRSGDYEQGKDTLKSDNKFCCLGVLLDIHDSECWDRKIECDKYDSLYRLGLDAEQVSKCISMNDTRSMSFSKIAKVIEEEF